MDRSASPRAESLSLKVSSYSRALGVVLSSTILDEETASYAFTVFEQLDDVG